MTAADRAELEAIRRDIRSILGQMDALSARLRRGFSGIGSEYCAKAVDLAAGKCRLAQKGLLGLGQEEGTGGAKHG